MAASVDVFAALASPVRRRILEVLVAGPTTVNDLVAHFELRRPAISEHLQVLRNARLVRDERRGRERMYHVEAASLVEVAEWLEPFERYWRGRINRLNQVLKEEESHG